jgi:hypothetical protein
MGGADSQKLLPRRGRSHSPPGRKPPAYCQINSIRNVRDSRPRRRHGVPRQTGSPTDCLGHFWIADVGQFWMAPKSLQRAGFASERVALGHPVMPIADSFGGGVVGVDSGQL